MSTVPASYVPMLKAKQGECKAIAQLSQQARSIVTPFFDVPRPKNLHGVEFDKHVLKVCRRISNAWGPSRMLFIDFFDIPLDIRFSTGTHPVVATFSELSNVGVLATPVFGFDRDSSYLAAVRSLPALSVTGLCVRLLDDDLLSPPQLHGQLGGLPGLFGLPPSMIDILIDLRSISAKSLPSLRQLALDAIAAVRQAGRFRSIILAGSNYLRDVSPIPRDSVGFVEREEFTLWKDLATFIRRQAFVRFGDYGVVHPDFVELGPVPNANAKIRYTLSGHWMVARGHSLAEPPGYQQYHGLAAIVADSQHFSQRHYSWGDSYISDCARRLTGTGNLGTWVSVDTNHHIEVVARQVSADVRTAQLDRIERVE